MIEIGDVLFVFCPLSTACTVGIGEPIVVGTVYLLVEAHA